MNTTRFKRKLVVWWCKTFRYPYNIEGMREINRKLQRNFINTKLHLSNMSRQCDELITHLLKEHKGPMQ